MGLLIELRSGFEISEKKPNVINQQAPRFSYTLGANRFCFVAMFFLDRDIAINQFREFPDSGLLGRPDLLWRRLLTELHPEVVIDLSPKDLIWQRLWKGRELIQHVRAAYPCLVASQNVHWRKQYEVFVKRGEVILA